MLTDAQQRNATKKFDAEWEAISPTEKKLELFRRQEDLLDTFLATGAISQAQHDKSLNCLIEKLGIKDEDQ